MFNFSGSYTCSQSFSQTPTPNPIVDGIGSIGLPLNTRDARLIIDNASQAPYGHNEQTIVNSDVRDTWEIGADKITTQNPDWEAFLKDTVVPSVLQALGMQVAAPVCELYKLLLYQEGSQCVLGFFFSSIFIIPRTCSFHPHQEYVAVIQCILVTQFS